MSDFNYQGEQGQSFSKKPNVLSAQFNEGYEQRIAFGINNKLRKWQLNFIRENTDIDAIETFLDTKGGLDSFTWTPQGFTEVTVICRDWAYNYLGGVARSLTCVFEEVAE
jgi:phage-related protein